MSTNLSTSTVTTSQTSKEAAINTIIGQIDAKLTETATITMEQSTASYTLTTENQTRAHRIACNADGGDPPTASKDLVFTTVKGMHILENNIAYDIVVKISTTTQFTLPAGQKALIYNTGSDIEVLAIAKTTENVTIGLYHKGTPTANEPLWGLMFTEALTLPASLTGSQFRADVAPSGGAVAFAIHKNGGASSGTINFADGSNTATVTFASPVDFAAGDRIELIAPADLHSMGELFVSFQAQRTVVA